VGLLLTSDLLVTHISRGKIKPEYAAFDLENLELARLLIETFDGHIGRKYGELLAELESYEEMNYRFIRGLTQLLGRRAVIETDAVIAPSLAREAVFEACGGMALSDAEKEEAMQKAAERLSISVSELEEALWADLEENQVLKSFLPLSPAELLKQYNISLTQTLLFRAVDLDIWIKGNFQKMLWKILRSGLMYSLEDTETTTGENEAKVEEESPERLKDVHLHLDGPASLFRMSERYGNSFAKLFPTLLRSKGWKLKAGILFKGYQGKRVLEFTLDDSEEAFNPKLEAMLEVAGYQEFSSGFQLEEEQEGYVTEKKEQGFKEKGTGTAENESRDSEKDSEIETYDSTLEQMFGSLSLGSWKIKREPTVLKAGRYAFIPDFVLQRDSMKVYLEIVGFWTPEYLKKKIQKLKEVREPVILLINRKLKCSEKDFPAQDVIFFDRKIPANEVMQVLRKYEEQKLSEDLSITQEMEIPFSGELINLEQIAAEKGILLGALKEVIAGRLAKAGEYGESGEAEGSGESREFGKLKDYMLLENYIIKRQLLDKIGLELEKSAVETYADAVKVFESFKLDRSLYYPVLEQLGYRVIWTGLSEEGARIKR
jgi:predicted nuclease of restriction endonuclease-like RecB superfamily